MMNRGMRGNNARGLGLGGSRTRGGVSRPNVSQEESERIMEEQNDQELRELGSIVGSLKEVVVDISGTVDEQNSFLEGLMKSMSGATNSVKGTVGRLDEVFKTGGYKHLCMLVAFSFFVLMGLYFLIKSRPSS
ncbi:Bet1-like SNARE 1-2 [Diplonema papillatum]|nr:Bet1-like SNARE 1-2 [Diplonema papillatum]